MTGLESWLAQLSPTQRDAVDALRAIVAAADPELAEVVKWNAPNFVKDGQDRITLGLNPRGGYRVVLHRGARETGGVGFRFEDPDSLADWPSPDRGVIRLADKAEIEAKAAALRAIFGRWLVA